MRRLAFLTPALALVVLAAPGCKRDAGAGAAGADAAADDIRAGLFDRPVLEQAAYLFGFQMGSQLRQQLPDSTLADELDYDLILAGFRTAFRGDTLPYDNATLMRVTRTIDDSLLLRQLRRESASTADTAAAGGARRFLARIERGRATADSFMTANARRDSVQTDDSGVQYTVLEPGEGETPNRRDVVMVELAGHLLDGTTLTETPPGQTVPVVVGAFAVEGLNAILLEMKPGERRRVWIPPALAFGMGGIPNQGPQPGIPPASVVIFDVKLAEVMGPQNALGSRGMGAPSGAVPPTAPPAGN